MPVVQLIAIVIKIATSRAFKRMIAYRSPGAGSWGAKTPGLA